MRRKLNYFAGVVALLMAGMAGVAPAAAPAEDPLDPPVTQGEVTIRLPKGWSVQQRANAVLVAFAPTPDKEEAGEFVTNFTIVAKPAVGKVNGDAQQKLLQRAFVDYRPMERPTLVTVGGLQGLFFGGVFTSNGLLLRSRQYLFTANNQVYILTTTGLASKWAAYASLIEASVGTFSVKGGAPAPAAPIIATPGATPATPAAPVPPGRITNANVTPVTPGTPANSGGGIGAAATPSNGGRPTMSTSSQPAGR